MAAFKKGKSKSFSGSSEFGRNSDRFGRSKPSFRPFGARGGSRKSDDDRDRFSDRPKRFDPDRSYGRRDSDRSFGRKGKWEDGPFKIVCDKCGKESDVPFKPTSGKPVYCSDCFRKKDDSGSRRDSGVSQEELDKINEKLDKIMAALQIDQD